MKLRLQVFQKANYFKADPRSQVTSLTLTAGQNITNEEQKQFKLFNSKTRKAIKKHFLSFAVLKPQFSVSFSLHNFKLS